MRSKITVTLFLIERGALQHQSDMPRTSSFHVIIRSFVAFVVTRENSIRHKIRSGRSFFERFIRSVVVGVGWHSPDGIKRGAEERKKKRKKKRGVSSLDHTNRNITQIFHHGIPFLAAENMKSSANSIPRRDCICLSHCRSSHPITFALYAPTF